MELLGGHGGSEVCDKGRGKKLGVTASLANVAEEVWEGICEREWDGSLGHNEGKKLKRWRHTQEDGVSGRE